METKFLFFLNFDRVPRNSTCLTQPARLRNTISIRDSADFSKASAFHQGVEKVKENDKNTKIEKLQNGQEKYGGKNLAYVYSWGKN